MNIDYERMKKYFAQKMPVWPLVAGFACVGIGLLMVVILANTRGISRGLMTWMGLAFLLVGAVDLIIYFAKKIKDSELDVYLPEIERQFMDDFRAQFTETDPAKLRYAQTYGAMHKHEDKFEPVLCSTFCFDRPELLHKTGDDSKVRSSVYAVSAFALRLDVIDLGEREVSLISDEKPMEDRFMKVKYIDLASAELAKTEKSGYQGRTKYRHLRLVGNDGQTVMEFPILADASADEYVDDINVRIRRHKELAGENNNA